MPKIFVAQQKRANMALLTNSTNVAGILPAQYGSLVEDPIKRDALAFNPLVSSVVSISSHDFRIPILKQDAGAAWTPEGAEIADDDAVLDEITVTPSKVAGLSIISSELADDSSPEAQKIIGDGLARSIVDEIDKAFFGNLAAPAPKGLASVAGVAAISGNLANLDVFAEAISAAELSGANITAFVCNPADALTIAKLKTAAGHNAPLLGSDATAGTARRALGVPILSTRHVPAGIIWGLDGSRQTTVLRRGTELAVDRSSHFTSDRVAIRAISRIGYGFAQPHAIVKLTVTSGS